MPIYNNNNNNVYLIKRPYKQEPFKGAVQIICNIILPQTMCVKPCNDLKDNNYLSVKATLNRCVFRRDLKFPRDVCRVRAKIRLLTSTKDVSLSQHLC